LARRLSSGAAATLNDVAALAGVSRQTVSRVINNKGEVSQSTIDRVLVAIAELNYRPNSIARSLVTNRSLVIGLVVPNISQPFYPEIARGVEDMAYQAGYSVFLCHTGGSTTRELQALERLRGHQVDGVIICNSRLEDDALTYASTGISPVVLVNRDVPNVEGTVIWTGYDTGSLLAVNHLLSLGRRRIAYIGLDYYNNVDLAKYQGYLSALQQSGITPNPAWVHRGTNTFQCGYDAMASYHKSGIQIDAIYAFNDPIAIGAMRFALTHGISVPGRVAIVGFGGSDVAGMVTPDLTTVAVPLYSIGTTAVEELLCLIDGTGEEHRHVAIQPELIVRESTVETGLRT
jgi:LacI family transcriptional regulator